MPLPVKMTGDQSSSALRTSHVLSALHAALQGTLSLLHSVPHQTGKYRSITQKKTIPFPVHICVADKRPDIVLFSDSLQTVILIELTCPAEENIADAQLRKEIKYTPLKDQIKDNKWKCHLMTIEVGARGFVSGSVWRCLRKLGFANSNIHDLLQKVSLSAARCSFAIYRSYQAPKWRWNPLVKIG